MWVCLGLYLPIVCGTMMEFTIVAPVGDPHKGRIMDLLKNLDKMERLARDKHSSLFESVTQKNSLIAVAPGGSFEW